MCGCTRIITFVHVFAHLIRRDINRRSSVRQRGVSKRSIVYQRGIPSVQTALTDNLRRGGKESGSKKCFFSDFCFPFSLILFSQRHSSCFAMQLFSLETVDLEKNAAVMEFTVWSVQFVTSPPSVLPSLPFLCHRVPLNLRASHVYFLPHLSLASCILSSSAVSSPYSGFCSLSSFPSELPLLPPSSPVILTLFCGSLLFLPPCLPSLLRLEMKSWRSMVRAPKAWSTRVPSNSSRVEVDAPIWCSRGVMARCLNMVGQSMKTFPSPPSSHPEPEEAQWMVVGWRWKNFTHLRVGWS